MTSRRADRLLRRISIPGLALPLVLAAWGCAGGASADAQVGQMLVDQNHCAGCHQSSHPDAGVLSGGDAPVGGSTIYAPNLTPDRKTGLGGWTDTQIIGAIREGTDDGGKALCSAMPRFDTLSDRNAADLVAYLRSLPPLKHEVPGGSCN